MMKWIFFQTMQFFQRKNKFIATGDVFLKQGDSLELKCDSLNYDGKIKNFLAMVSIFNQ